MRYFFRSLREVRNEESDDSEEMMERRRGAAEKGGYIYLANHHYVFLKNDPGFRYILTSQEVFATLLIKPTQGYDD